MTDTAPMEIDEGLQSRQLAVYGEETMKRMSAHSVLISGLNGLGAEVAKNVILANFKRVALHDNLTVTPASLSSHFYLTEDDLGKNRAAACVHRLQELNPTVVVTVESRDLSPQVLNEYQTVVILDTFARGLSEARLVEIDEYCRTHTPSINFITGDTLSVFGRVFCDFGPEFTVFDVDGEQPLTAIVAGITVGESEDGKKNLLVACVDESRLEFSDGDLIRFSEVSGLSGINECGPLPVTVKSPYSFFVPIPPSVDLDSSYIRGGIVTQVKLSKKLSFQSLGERLRNPDMFLETDFSKFGRSQLLHLLFRALDGYRAANVNLPEPGNADQAKSLASLVSHVNDTDMDASVKMAAEEIASESNGKVIDAFSRTCRGTINPMCAILGGIIGQEVTKAASGKFHPLFQWLYVDFVEALPENIPDEELEMTGSRYDGQVAVFGKSFQEKLASLRLFLVGAGALGCEFLKNFAMMGVATGEKGGILITDDDNIERSNLSRQFLFRNWHVSQSKSKTAATVIHTMNPNVRITPMQDRVAHNTENIFNDNFWMNLDVVCNALDNVKARLYVDQRCVFYGKPLMESGTLGTKCNTQMVLPHKTENYGASADPPEKEAPDCTLHNFPHNINHCLSWARSEFIGNFEVTPSELRRFLEGGSATTYVKTLGDAGSVPPEIVQKLHSVLESIHEAPTSFEDCIGWARRKFEDYFANRIKQLTFNFPRTATTNSGLPFWSPPKRFPTPLAFDSSDPTHIKFVIAGANLRAKTFSIGTPANNRDPEYFKAVLSNVLVPDFVPRSGVAIQTDANAQSSGGVAVNSNDAEKEIADLIEKFQSLSVGAIASSHISVEEFEKDDDKNHHMDFISAVGNLRGRCYEITEVPQFQAKLIAGRIIPAIATTTSMATGFVCMELYKLVQDKPMDSFRNTFANLALPLFAMSEPMPAKKVVSRVVKNVPDPINHPEYEEEEEIKAYPEGHTVWDKLEVRNCAAMTLAEIQTHFEETHHIVLASLAVGSSDGKGKMIFNALLPRTRDNLSLTVAQIVEKFCGGDPREINYIVPAILFEDEDGQTVETPEILFWLWS